MIRMSIYRTMATCSDHQEICRRRTRIPGHLRRQTTKVILQLRTLNSALLSNPKLLNRLQLKLLQISTSRQSHLHSGLRITDHLQHTQGNKIFQTKISHVLLTEDLPSTIGPRSHFLRIGSIPTTDLRRQIKASVLDPDLLRLRS